VLPGHWGNQARRDTAHFNLPTVLNNLNQHLLWQLCQGHKLRYLRAMLAMALGILLSFGVPLVTLAAIDGPLGGWARERFGKTAADTRLTEMAAWLGLRQGMELWLAGALILSLAMLSGLALYLRSRWAAVASEGIVRAVRQKLSEHLAKLPSSYYDSADTGDLVQRCTSDVETLRMFLSTQVVEIGRAVLLLCTAAPILFYLNAELAMVSLVLMPVIVAFAWFFFRRIRVLFQEMDEAEGKMTTVLQENLTAIRVVRAFARQDYEKEKFSKRNGAFRDTHARFVRLLAMFWSASDMLCLTQVGLVLMSGAHFVSTGKMSLGTLAAFLEFEYLIIWPVRQMGRVLADAGKATVAQARLQEILQVPEESDLDPEPNQQLLPLTGLNFAFGDEGAALQDIGFKLKAGETLALIGPPGSGKTTLIQLLLRLYDHTEGSIQFDGRPSTELPRRFLRSHFGVVMQEPFLYSKTVRANLTLGSLNASAEQVTESTTAAAIHDSILEFKEGYETLVGERGVTLSGGQRQRIALARALLMKPKLLVLDDALSAVDTETESRILQALEERRGKQTTILIAHRLSSVLHADQILVLDHGRIQQSGNHGELIAVEGPYRRLWSIQGALENEIREDLHGVDYQESKP
jgi:ATP-binding cassette subfamily B protein